MLGTFRVKTLARIKADVIVTGQDGKVYHLADLWVNNPAHVNKCSLQAAECLVGKNTIANVEVQASRFIATHVMQGQKVIGTSLCASEQYDSMKEFKRAITDAMSMM